MAHTVCSEGIVEQIHGDEVHVRLLGAEACGGCKAHGHCTASQAGGRKVTVRSDETYQVGDRVEVSASGGVAARALWLAFGLPLLLLAGVAVACQALVGNEKTAALAALGSLAVYYLLLYQLCGKVSKAVTLQIRRKY